MYLYVAHWNIFMVNKRDLPKKIIKCWNSGFIDKMLGQNEPTLWVFFARNSLQMHETFNALQRMF